jgi:uncharacterized cofD-like protein
METLTHEASTHLKSPLETNGVCHRFVCIGGGTGLPVVLRGLARRMGRPPALEVTAVVGMSDDGGSSGRLRRTRGLLPPGDVRNCLVALAGKRDPLAELLQYRFSGRQGLAGHSVGNLLIAALAEQKGDFLEAVRVMGALLETKGTVLPSTLCPVELVAQKADERHVRGERNIVKSPGKVRHVELWPQRPPPSEGLLEAISRADLVTLGPGSLYSSLLPNLLVDGVADALRASRGLKVLISNLMTEPGETDGMGCREHLAAVLNHVGPVVDVVLLNGTTPNAGAALAYERKGSRVVAPDPAGARDLGIIPFVADLLRPGRRIRHDGDKLARVLLRLARDGV